MGRASPVRTRLYPLPSRRPASSGHDSGLRVDPAIRTLGIAGGERGDREAGVLAIPAERDDGAGVRNATAGGGIAPWVRPDLAAIPCGARTRAGGACRAPAVRGKARCRMHGGALGSGAPRGNHNARKHGYWSAGAHAARRRVAVLIEIGTRLLADLAAVRVDAEALPAPSDMAATAAAPAPGAYRESPSAGSPTHRPPPQGGITRAATPARRTGESPSPRGGRLPLPGPPGPSGANPGRASCPPGPARSRRPD